MMKLIETFTDITKTPEEAGITKKTLDDCINFLRVEKNLDIHSFLVVRYGKLVCEQYFRDGEREKPHVMYSVSKSFVSTAIGMAADKGLLSVEDEVFKFFPEYRELLDSDYKRELKVKHLLMMGTGWTFDGNSVFESGPDLAREILARPITNRPGTVFTYYSIATYLLSVIFTKVSGDTVHDYLKKTLYRDLGIKGARWSKSKQGYSMGGWGLYICAYDMAKLGQLYLNKGLWNGKRILSEEYIDAATSFQISNGDPISNPKDDKQCGYGYQFWRCTYGGYRADGMYGQYIMLKPDKDLIVVITSKIDDMQIPLDMVRDILVPALA